MVPLSCNLLAACQKKSTKAGFSGIKGIPFDKLRAGAGDKTVKSTESEGYVVWF
jgi:hypothetical protein